MRTSYHGLVPSAAKEKRDCIFLLAMGLIEFLRSIFRGRGSLPTAVVKDETKADGGCPVPPPVVTPGPAPVPPAPKPPTGPNPDRQGTFIVADIYSLDLDRPNTKELDVPPFEALLGYKFPDGKEMVGCVIKCGQGLGQPRSFWERHEEWFRKCWRRMKEVGGERTGVDWFRGCYYFLQLGVDGAKQADRFCDLLESAGGLEDTDLMPWLDIEEGGQGNWTGGKKLETITDAATLKRLQDDVRRNATDFIRRFKERTGKRIAVYGRGIFRDLRMPNARFDEDAYVNPAYTVTMPTMEKHGVPLDHIKLWQLCGDGYVVAKGFVGHIPGWGDEDYSVYIDGANKTTLAGFRRDNLAKKP